MRSLSSLKETPFADGWLCFESRDEKRRLAPIPIGWEFRETPQLEELCRAATPVPTRRRINTPTSEVAAPGPA